MTKQLATWTTFRHVKHAEDHLVCCHQFPTALNIITHGWKFEAHAGVYVGLHHISLVSVCHQLVGRFGYAFLISLYASHNR
jgi:hypothetical protein